MSPRDLIEVARFLAESARGRLAQASLRRAVSTAYYAMFHCLAGNAADLFIGRPRGPAWHRAYRSLEHGKARHACQNRQAMQEFPSGIRDFADLFVTLQKARQRADYALEGRYEKPDVVAAIDRAEDAIAQLERVDVRRRRSFAAHVLFRQRPS